MKDSVPSGFYDESPEEEKTKRTVNALKKLNLYEDVALNDEAQGWYITTRGAYLDDLITLVEAVTGENIRKYLEVKDDD